MNKRALNLSIVFIFLFAFFASCCLPQFAAAKEASHQCCPKAKASANQTNCDGHCLRAVVETSQNIINHSVNPTKVDLAQTYQYKINPPAELSLWKAPPEEFRKLSAISSQKSILRI